MTGLCGTGPLLERVTAPGQVEEGPHQVDSGTDPEDCPPLSHLGVVSQETSHHGRGHKARDITDSVGHGKCYSWEMRSEYK